MIQRASLMALTLSLGVAPAFAENAELPIRKPGLWEVSMQITGVSKATVSRFLNHRDTLLSADIATRVEQAVAALGYTPNPMAQALKRGRSKLIGLVVALIRRRRGPAESRDQSAPPLAPHV